MQHCCIVARQMTDRQALDLDADGSPVVRIVMLRDKPGSGRQAMFPAARIAGSRHRLSSADSLKGRLVEVFARCRGGLARPADRRPPCRVHQVGPARTSTAIPTTSSPPTWRPAPDQLSTMKRDRADERALSSGLCRRSADAESSALPKAHGYAERRIYMHGRTPGEQRHHAGPIYLPPDRTASPRRPGRKIGTYGAYRTSIARQCHYQRQALDGP